MGRRGRDRAQMPYVCWQGMQVVGGTAVSSWGRHLMTNTQLVCVWALECSRQSTPTPRRVLMELLWPLSEWIDRGRECCNLGHPLLCTPPPWTELLPLLLPVKILQNHMHTSHVRF